MNIKITDTISLEIKDAVIARFHKCTEDTDVCQTIRDIINVNIGHPFKTEKDLRLLEKIALKEDFSSVSAYLENCLMEFNAEDQGDYDNLPIREYPYCETCLKTTNNVCTIGAKPGTDDCQYKMRVY